MSSSPLYPHILAGATIRLLTVEPGEPGSPLRCSLQELSLDSTSTTPYYALSYVWGSTQDSIPITCNSYQLAITSNLHSALLEYRSRGINIPLWVDAVCINQSDIAERTAQVRMMQEIYSKAECVVVWLGKAAATDGPALDLLKTINAPWATFRDHMGREIPLFTGQDMSSHDAEIGAQVPDSYFDALAAFLMRPWFSRIWIVQELLCAKQVTMWCGAATLDEFPVLEAAGRLLQMFNCGTRANLATTALPDPEVQLKGRLKMGCAGQLEALKWSRKEGLGGILHLLLISRYFNATDARDKIFALVGLVQDVQEEFVDYAKSYEEVIRELSRMILDGSIKTELGCRLDLWSCISRDEDEDVDRPSWVVDWLKLKDSLYTPLMGQYPTAEPMIQRKSEIRFGKDDDGKEILNIRATIFDTITHIVPSPIPMREMVPQSTFLTAQHLDPVLDWHATVVDLVVAPAETDPIYHPTGTSLYDAFWRTLCCNRSANTLTSPPADDNSYVAWRRCLDIQQMRCAAEASYYRANKLQKRWFWAISTITITALTYRFRKHKFLAVAIPFTLPATIQWFNKTWDMGLKMLLVALFNEYMKQNTQPQIESRDFEASHSQWTQGRQFAVTSEGRIGWVPVAARVGDCVGLFAGCRVPYVLRGMDRGWRIVGDAYLHGVMHGEGEGSEGSMVRII